MNNHLKQSVSTVEHSGDLEIVARGADELEAIASASVGLIHQIIAVEDIAELEERSLIADGDTDQDRVIAFLNELLYLVYTKNWLPRRVRTLTRCNRTGCRRLEAVLIGEPLDRSRHEFKYDIKAVTYHGFELAHDAGGVTLRFVCDL